MYIAVCDDQLNELDNSGFNDHCEVWIEYGAEGNQDDGGYLGDTIWIVKAIK